MQAFLWLDLDTTVIWAPKKSNDETGVKYNAFMVYVLQNKNSGY